MNASPFFLAELPADPPAVSWPQLLAGALQYVWLYSILAGVSLLVLAWAFFFRSRRHHRSHHHHSRPAAAARASMPPAQNGSGFSFLSSKRHKRRRRRQHRPRNPTLAETGGLPPLRSERPPTPSS